MMSANSSTPREQPRTPTARSERWITDLPQEDRDRVDEVKTLLAQFETAAAKHKTQPLGEKRSHFEREASRKLYDTFIEDAKRNAKKCDLKAPEHCQMALHVEQATYPLWGLVYFLSTELMRLLKVRTKRDNGRVNEGIKEFEETLTQLRLKTESLEARMTRAQTMEAPPTQEPPTPLPTTMVAQAATRGATQPTEENSQEGSGNTNSRELHDENEDEEDKGDDSNDDDDDDPDDGGGDYGAHSAISPASLPLPTMREQHAPSPSSSSPTMDDEQASQTAPMAKSSTTAEVISLPSSTVAPSTSPTSQQPKIEAQTTTELDSTESRGDAQIDDEEKLEDISFSTKATDANGCNDVSSPPSTSLLEQADAVASEGGDAIATSDNVDATQGEAEESTTNEVSSPASMASLLEQTDAVASEEGEATTNSDNLVVSQGEADKNTINEVSSHASMASLLEKADAVASEEAEAIANSDNVDATQGGADENTANEVSSPASMASLLEQTDAVVASEEGEATANSDNLVVSQGETDKNATVEQRTDWYCDGDSDGEENRSLFCSKVECCSVS